MKLVAELAKWVLSIEVESEIFLRTEGVAIRAERPTPNVQRPTPN